MDILENDDKGIKPEDLMDLICSGEAELGKLHESMIEKTIEVGFALESYRQMKDNFSIIIDASPEIVEFSPILSSGYDGVKAINDDIRQIRSSLAVPMMDIRWMAQNVITTSSSSGTIVATIIPDYQLQLDPPESLKPDTTRTIKILESLDGSLAKTYKEIEQVHYATDADNIRASIGLQRQFFDHFFSNLSPDDAVRKSKYWKLKVGENDEQLITRLERMQYAVSTHVKNPFRAKTLESNLGLIIDAYKVLNSFHTRGQINLKAARQALFTVKHFLEDFAEAIAE